MEFQPSWKPLILLVNHGRHGLASLGFLGPMGFIERVADASMSDREPASLP